MSIEACRTIEQLCGIAQAIVQSKLHNFYGRPKDNNIPSDRISMNTLSWYKKALEKFQEMLTIFTSSC